MHARFVKKANVLEMVALTEQQQSRLQIWKNNWIRRTASVQRRRMKDIKEQIGKETCIGIVKRQMRCAGHMPLVIMMRNQRLLKMVTQLPFRSQVIIPWSHIF